MKLILIFRSVLWPQAFLVRRTHFISAETSIYLFFKYYFDTIDHEILLNALDFRKKQFHGLNRIYREEPVKLILIKSFRTQEILFVAFPKDLY